MTLAWTTTLPTEPGMYWTRIAAYPPIIVEVRAYHECLMVIGAYPGLVPVEYYGHGDATALQMQHEWAGPLLPPESP
jgi:hypothetical protein